MRKRSIRIAGHATSVSLEDEFWAALQKLATTEAIGINDLIARIDGEKKGANLSSALRLHVLKSLQIRQIPTLPVSARERVP